MRAFDTALTEFALTNEPGYGDIMSWLRIVENKLACVFELLNVFNEDAPDFFSLSAQ